MLPKLIQLLKKYGFWLALVVILFVPQIRMPFQIYLNQAFGLINWVTIEEGEKDANLDELVLLAEDGTEISGSELKNKVIFINLWATWCPPCIAEMPSIQKLSDDYGDKVKIVLVSNEKPEIVQAFFEKHEYDLNTYVPLSQYPDSFEVSSIPRTYLISKSGQIIIDKKGAANWNGKKIRKQLDVLLSE